MIKLQMVDLVSQYHKIKPEVDAAVMDVMEKAMFIGGEKVMLKRSSICTIFHATHLLNFIKNLSHPI